MASSWRMDEAYIEVRGKWTCFCRAVDRDRQPVDLLLCECRDLAAAFRKTL